ncbi:UNVERIFIED_CONTAM: xpo7-b [Trichonephila clavipes]
MPMRRTDVKLTRLRIGHTRFTHRHLLFGENAPKCPSCKVSYTDLTQLEVLCKQFYDANNPEERATAEKALVNFVHVPDCLPTCRLLLERGDVNRLLVALVFNLCQFTKPLKL